jgi:hypothetical protein
MGTSRPTCWPAAILSTRGTGGVMEYMLYGDLKTSLLARCHLVNERNRWGHGVHAVRGPQDLPAGPPPSCQREKQVGSWSTCCTGTSRPTCWPAAILSMRETGGVMEYMLYGDLKTYLLARRHLVNRNRWGHGVQAAPRFQDPSDLPAGPPQFF